MGQDDIGHPADTSNKVEFNVSGRKRNAEDQGEISGKRTRCNSVEEITAMSSTSEIIVISSDEEDLDIQQSPANEKSNNIVLVSQDRSTLSEDKVIYEMASLGNLGSRDDFKEKYKQLGLIGSGGFGCVYNGYRKSDRKSDRCPVAIKCIPKHKVVCQKVTLNGTEYNIILEVAFMLKLSGLAGSRKESGIVSLMDFYNLENELILVMERGCKNLLDYWNDNGGTVKETNAKLILKQLVDVAINMHSQAIFHQDIKMQNVLINDNDEVPKVRIIDFGCSKFCRTEAYTSYRGTCAYAPPEYRSKKCCWSRPTTVWQLGMIYYKLVIGEFYNSKCCQQRLWESSISPYSKLLLKKCLNSEPQYRVSLEWLQQSLSRCR